MRTARRLLATGVVLLATGGGAAARPLILPTPTPTPAPWEVPETTASPAPTPSPSPIPEETPAPWETAGPEVAPASPIAKAAVTSPAALPAPLVAVRPQDPVFLTADLLLGSKQLSSPGQFVPAQGSLGLALTLGPRDWPIALALDGFASAGMSTLNDAGEKYEASTATWAVGARRVFELPVMRPFVGAGMEWERATAAHTIPGVSRSTDFGSAFGPWGEAGTAVRIGRILQLGIYARYDSAWVTVGGRNLDAGGFQFGALLGVGMGAAAIPPGVPLL